MELAFVFADEGIRQDSFDDGDRFLVFFGFVWYFSLVTVFEYMIIFLEIVGNVDHFLENLRVSFDHSRKHFVKVFYVLRLEVCMFEHVSFVFIRYISSILLERYFLTFFLQYIFSVREGSTS